MKDTFYKLSEDKRVNIINSSIEEFAHNTYETASLNKIIARAKISKGGLFKYIDSKSDLYMFITTGILEKVIIYQSKKIDITVKCYFDRLLFLMKSGFEYYKNKPLEFKLILNALNDVTSPNHNLLMEKRKELILKYQSDLIVGIDWMQYKIKKHEILRISEYMIEGYNLSLLKKSFGNLNIEEFEYLIIKDINLLINTLKNGVKGE